MKFVSADHSKLEKKSILQIEPTTVSRVSVRVHDVQNTSFSSMYRQVATNQSQKQNLGFNNYLMRFSFFIFRWSVLNSITNFSSSYFNVNRYTIAFQKYTVVLSDDNFLDLAKTNRLKYL